MPSCSRIFELVVCMNGKIRMDTMRRASARLCMTVSSLLACAGSFASAQGMVSSMYLFVRRMTFQISSSAILNWNLSMAASTSL